MEAVLLLNASFEPIRVISWQRAVCMWFSGKVEVVQEYDHSIRSISIIIKAPAVVRLLNFVNVRRRTPPLSKVNVVCRDQFQCQYCRKSVTLKEATLDHVIPRRLGGNTSWKNIVCCCVACNRKKGGHTPKDAGMPLIKEPRIPDWLPVLTFSLSGQIPHSWQEFIQRWR